MHYSEQEARVKELPKKFLEQAELWREIIKTSGIPEEYAAAFIKALDETIQPYESGYVVQGATPGDFGFSHTIQGRWIQILRNKNPLILQRLDEIRKQNRWGEIGSTKLNTEDEMLLNLLIELSKDLSDYAEKLNNSD